MTHPTPFRRKVFYLPGYDPIPARKYREIYRREGALQAQVSGYDLSMKADHAGGRFGWHVQTDMGGQRCDAHITVLEWSDIVKSSMTAGIWGTYRMLFATAWIYIGSGALWRLMKLRAGPVIAALYPIVFLLVQAALALALAGLAAWVLALLAWPLAFAALPIAPAVIWWFRRQDHRFYAYYLMHDYAYSAKSNGAYDAALETRLAQFTAEVAAALRSGVDEVLVVGHSSGAYLGVSLLADLLRMGQEGPKQDTAKLAFVTLGHVVPMVSFLRDAHRLRKDLHDLSQADGLFWLDVTAPGDGCAFALCDPVAVSGVAPKEQKWPLMISAAFHHSLSPEMLQRLKRRYFRLHFQYIHAFDRPQDYDYFQITAGPVTLNVRYADRAPSPSTVRRAVSKFTSMEARS